jgi:hypothetical protein
MPRTVVLCLVGFLSSSYVPVLAQDNAAQTAAQPSDPQTGKLVKEIEDLKQSVAEQDKRIAELEKAVKILQAALIPVPKPIPANTPPWRSPSSWNQIKTGMPEAQVVEILGPPTSVQSVTDSRILFYQPDAHSTSSLSGTVTLMDDRVIAMSPPEF